LVAFGEGHPHLVGDQYQGIRLVTPAEAVGIVERQGSHHGSLYGQQ
jgi:hypothetical protein